MQTNGICIGTVTVCYIDCTETIPMQTINTHTVMWCYLNMSKFDSSVCCTTSSDTAIDVNNDINKIIKQHWHTLGVI